MKFGVLIYLFMQCFWSLSFQPDSLCAVTDLQQKELNDSIKSVLTEIQSFYGPIYNLPNLDSSSIQSYYEAYDSRGFLTEKRCVINLPQYTPCDSSSNSQYYSTSILWDDSVWVKEQDYTYSTQHDVYREIYSRDGRILEWHKLYSDHQSEVVYYNYMDEKLIEIVTTKLKGDTSMTEVFEYKRKKEIINLFIYSKELAHTTINYYNRSGRVIKKQIIQSGGVFLLNDKMRYDNLGNVISSVSGNGDKHEIEYEYDEHNNWTSAVSRQNGEITHITKRTFEYY